MKKLLSFTLCVILILSVVWTGNLIAFAVDTEGLTGTLHEYIGKHPNGSDLPYVVLELDKPLDIKVGDNLLYGVDEIHVALSDYAYDFSMDGKRVKVISHSGMLEWHTAYHMRPVVALGVKVEVLAPEISVTVNGTKLDLDQPPIAVNNRTLLPIRAIFQAFGATVNWNPDTQTATSTVGDKTITIPLGSNEIYVNDETVTLDVAATAMGNRILVPARAVAESLGCNVQWIGETSTVVITGK